MSNSIQLDAPSSGGPPAARFNTVGDSVVVGITNVSDYQQHNFDTKEAMFWDDGKPRMGKVVTGLVVTSDGAMVIEGDAERPAVAGDLVSFWCEGGKWFTYRDAVKASGGINVGDVMRWVRDADEPPKTRGAFPAKKYTGAIRRPNASDGDLADRCVAAYHAQQNRPALDSAPAERQMSDVF